MSGRTRALLSAVAVVGGAALLIVLLVIVTSSSSPASGSPAGASSHGTNVDPGTTVSGRAPDFTLTDQFGRRVSLRSFRGQVVILAFNDSQCTTVCPLTTTAMVDARRALGAAGAHVKLLGVDANPDARSVADVRAYSRAHGMLHSWSFLTGSRAQLERVWKAYGIAVEIAHGLIDHTPALFAIDPHGRLRKVYMTQMNYTSVPDLGQVLAQEASTLLPGHPSVRSDRSSAGGSPIAPSASVSLPRAGGGTLRLGPGGSARLLVFFATWDAEDFPGLGRQLRALDGYQAAAARDRLPPLTAVDEGSVEPSASALPRFLRGLHGPLSYPVAIDRSGRIADGYQVQDQPWMVLVSRRGRILWSYDVSTQGWLSRSMLIARVRNELAHPPATATSSPTVATRALAGSPAPLAALHRQAGRLLGSGSALRTRLRALRGHPVVVNAWASWCAPCQHEFPLFAAASVRYGRQVAFVGVDTNDAAPDARSFLSKHHVSYPSYQATSGQLAPLANVEGMPTTIFLNPAGKVVHVHVGQYPSQGALDADVDTYAIGG